MRTEKRTKSWTMRWQSHVTACYSMLHVTASKASNYSVELMDNFYSCQILSCISEVRLYRRIECSGGNRNLPTIFAELPYSCLHRRSWFLFSFLLIPMFAQDHLPPTHRSPHPTSISPISSACLCKALLTICKISIYTKTLFRMALHAVSCLKQEHLQPISKLENIKENDQAAHFVSTWLSSS